MEQAVMAQVQKELQARKPERRRRAGSPAPGAVNTVTGKSYPDATYAVSAFARGVRVQADSRNVRASRSSSFGSVSPFSAKAPASGAQPSL